jgi:hypothetical protein
MGFSLRVLQLKCARSIVISTRCLLEQDMETEKRRFQRIPFDAKVRLTLTDADREPIIGVLQDISLKGALIAISESYPPLNVGDSGELAIVPDQGDFEITLTVDIAYVLSSKHHYGLNIMSFDVESAGHLRRLVEVNLGDEQSLQRELSNLVDAMEEEHRQG